MCQLLTEPERVTYAPGPSFRRLMDRIDGHGSREPRVGPSVQARASAASAAVWREPRLAWAASLVLAVGLAAVATTAYRWAQPRYATHTAPGHASPGVLHVAFERSLPIGEMEQMLRSAGARVVEGPDATGIFGIAPVSTAAAGSPSSEAAGSQMRALAARLHADQRVRAVPEVLAALSKDARVVLAQPLNEFHTLTGAAAPAAPYNDPLYDLQSNLVTLGIARAHARAQGAGVRIALIDTGVDARHPDLGGRIRGTHSFLGKLGTPRAGEPAAPLLRHGTAMAGLIAAVANNRS